MLTLDSLDHGNSPPSFFLSCHFKSFHSIPFHFIPFGSISCHFLGLLPTHLYNYLILFVDFIVRPFFHSFILSFHACIHPFVSLTSCSFISFHWHRYLIMLSISWRFLEFRSIETSKRAKIPGAQATPCPL